MRLGGERMDVLSIIFVVALVSLMGTFALLLSSLLQNSFRDMTFVNLASILLFVSLLTLYFDVQGLLNEKPNLIFTYFSFSSLLFSLGLFQRSIFDLYKKDIGASVFIMDVYSVFVGVMMVLATATEIYVLRSLVYSITLMFPFVVFVVRLIRSDLMYKKMIAFYQSVVVILLLFISAVNVIVLNVIQESNSIPMFDIIASLLVAIIIITMYSTYYNELNHVNYVELLEKNNLLQTINSKVKKASETDDLTKLYNRRKANEIVHSLSEKTSGFKHFSVLIVDINDFKNVNDTYGHSVGDQVLQFVANALVLSVRDTDFIARWGGDEFFVILTNIDESNTKKVIKKIKTYLRDNLFGINRLPVEVAIGYAVAKSDLSSQDLINYADKRMYIDKEKCKNKSKDINEK